MKRAEITPGVGELTDLMILGTREGRLQSTDLPEDAVEKLDEVYLELNQRSTEKIEELLEGKGFEIEQTEGVREEAREHQSVEIEKVTTKKKQNV